jgi:hypothetical protein
VKTQQPTLTTTIMATAALARFRFTGFTGATCAAGAKALGVAETEADSGEAASVNVSGILLVEAGAAIAVEAEVQSDGSGRAITLAAGKSNGFALDAAAAAGDIIRIWR